MIEVDGLVKEFDGKRILDGLSFRAEAGTITGFLGPNGAGKTTTMRVLATLLRPTAGTVRIAGFDVVADDVDVRRSIGLVTEEAGLMDRLTPREQLSLTAAVYDLGAAAIRTRIDVVADMLVLGPVLDKRAGTLSKGNRQKVALARALIHDPPVLLLDEPTANLDVVAQAALQDLLLTPEVAAGKTVLLSTHSLEEAHLLARQVVGIVAGKVVAAGSQDEITASVGAPDFRQAFLTLLASRTMEDGTAAPSDPTVEDEPTPRRRLARR